MTGEPSGLSVTLPKALAELTRTVPPGTRLMTGFDRGGSYASVFAHCRGQGVHLVSYRRAPLAVPAMLPVHTTITVNGMTRTIAWCEETVQIKDYGEARQLTLFEDGLRVLQVLTSDMDACPADLQASPAEVPVAGGELPRSTPRRTTGSIYCAMTSLRSRPTRPAPSPNPARK